MERGSAIFRVTMSCFILMVAVPAGVMAAEAPSMRKSAAAPGESISPKDAAAKVQKGQAVLVDVREHDETILGMAAPAKEMPLSEAQANTSKWQSFVQSLPKDKEIIVYCRSGRRSGIVGGMLTERGFTVKNMGGFQGWVYAGLPVKKP